MGGQPGARPVRTGQDGGARHSLHRRDRRGRAAPGGRAWEAAMTSGKQTLNQLAGSWTGSTCSSGVIVIAGTNRPDILDPALLRPGAFRPPDRGGPARPEGGAVQSSPSTPRASRSPKRWTWKRFARQTPGFTGADLANLINESALLAARRDKAEVGAGRAGGSHRPGDRRPGAQEPGDDRPREEGNRLPRRGPRPGGVRAARRRPDPQGDHHPPGPGRAATPCPSRQRTATTFAAPS